MGDHPLTSPPLTVTTNGPNDATYYDHQYENIHTMIPISQIGFSCQPRLTVFGAHEVPCSSLFRFPKHQATKWEDTQKILALESFISRAVDISVDYLFFSFSYASVIYRLLYSQCYPGPRCSDESPTVFSDATKMHVRIVRILPGPCPQVPHM